MKLMKSQKAQVRILLACHFNMNLCGENETKERKRERIGKEREGGIVF